MKNYRATCTYGSDDIIDVFPTSDSSGDIEIGCTENDHHSSVLVSRDDAIRLRDWLTVALGEGESETREERPVMPLRADEWECRSVWYLTEDTLSPPKGDGPWWLVATSSVWSSDQAQGVDVGIWARRRKEQKS